MFPTGVPRGVITVPAVTEVDPADPAPSAPGALTLVGVDTGFEVTVEWHIPVIIGESLVLVRDLGGREVQ